MDPCALVSYVGHLEQVRIKACVANGLLKQRFMGPRRTCGHNQTVEVVFFYHLYHLLLCILAAGKEISET